MFAGRRWLTACGVSVLVLGVSAAASSLAADQAGKAPVKAQHSVFRFVVKGATAAVVGTIADEVTLDGRQVRHTFDYFLTMMGGHMRQGRNVNTWYGADGRLIKINIEQLAERGEKLVKTTTDVAVGKDKVTITTKPEDGPAVTSEVAIPEGVTVYATADEYTIKQMGFKKGDKREYTIFSLNTMKLEKETLTAVDTKKVKYGGKEIEVYVYEQTDSDTKVPIEVDVSQEFNILHTVVGDQESFRVPNINGESLWGK